jgi:FO synthase subunit 1
MLQPGGWDLVARLPVYPQFDEWLSGDLEIGVKRWREKFGLAQNSPQIENLGL